ncbi:MAG: PilZ domain-containing protein [Treponema sp.]|nr:PilZ domain-containing protein [Treponema sp.]
MSVIIVLAAVVFILVFIRLMVVFKDKISFFSTGLDNSFKFGEVSVLWKLAKQCDLEDPMSLYVSVPALNRCISSVITKARHNGTENSFKVQNFLARLYKFRTRIALVADGKRGLDSTQSLQKGQRLRIILPGKGVFFARILNSGHEMVISLPRQKDVITVAPEEWVHQQIHVYFWRKGDAGYVFDSEVGKAGIFLGQDALFIRNSNQLLRTQKRQSIRCACQIYAEMFMIKTAEPDYTKVDNEGGFRCLLEDISEDGALIRIGGKGKPNVQIKLQFTLDEVFVMMFGVIRSVEFNAAMNQSRLHFECKHIEPNMKNAVLSFVYNVIPQEQKEVHEALSATEEDMTEAGDSAPAQEEPLPEGMEQPEFTIPVDDNETEEEILKELE